MPKTLRLSQRSSSVKGTSRPVSKSSFSGNENERAVYGVLRWLA